MPVNFIEKSFRPLFGQPCWGVRYDRQLNLSMNFGTPSLDIREPTKTNSTSEFVKRLAAYRNVTVRGESWLWIYCCFWRLSSESIEPVTGSSSFLRIERANKALDGQKLVSIDVNPKSGATRFEFDLGCVLECRRFNRESDDKLWMLYKPSGFVLSVHGNGTSSHQRGTDSPRPIEDVD